MSILIKGMNMPESCFECICTHKFFSIFQCASLPDFEFESDGIFPHLEDRSEFCPLVELPDHGDLIDRDELMKHEVYMPMSGGNFPLVYMSYVKGAKAVIPAERSDEWEFTSKT